MELEQLRIFCTVAACRSFTRAAKQLFVSHSTTSRAVSALLTFRRVFAILMKHLCGNRCILR